MDMVELVVDEVTNYEYLKKRFTSLYGVMRLGTKDEKDQYSSLRNYADRILRGESALSSADMQEVRYEPKPFKEARKCYDGVMTVANKVKAESSNKEYLANARGLVHSYKNDLQKAVHDFEDLQMESWMDKDGLRKDLVFFAHEVDKIVGNIDVGRSPF